jgi:hypothetical protein
MGSALVARAAGIQIAAKATALSDNGIRTNAPYHDWTWNERITDKATTNHSRVSCIPRLLGLSSA